MKGSRKGLTPPKLLAWLGNAGPEWQPAYPFDSAEVRDEVRSVLYAEQRGLCVYCGRGLIMTKPGKSYHIEHFRPQNPYVADATSYRNLFLSCGQEDKAGARADTCGTKKENWFDEDQHVYPAYPECTQKFRFKLDGSVAPRFRWRHGRLQDDRGPAPKPSRTRQR